jgi:hypothetical protein
MYSPPASLTRFLMRLREKRTSRMSHRTTERKAEPHALNDRHGAIGVELSDVTRPEPAVLGESLLVEVGPLEVALEQTRAAAEDLALRELVSREITGVGDVD